MKKRTVIRAGWTGCIGASLLLLTSCVAMMKSIATELTHASGYYTDYYASEESTSPSSSYTPTRQVTTASLASAPNDVYMTKAASDVDVQINWIWQKCQQEGIRDYDGNGIVNCCDKATAFCIKWKKQYSLSIRLCQQQTEKMNHMFVQIYLPGYGWWSVEPSFTVAGTHDMKVAWGRCYNRAYDDTEAYWVRVFSSYIR